MALGLWQIIQSTDGVSKGVMLVLLGMSVACWALAVYKKMVLRTKLKALQQARGLLHNTKSIDDFVGRLSVMQESFAGELITGFLTDFKKVVRLYDKGQALADRDWYLLQAAVQQRVDEVLIQESSLMSVLSTSAQSAPLLGLFGTVWGLIHSFMAIAQQRSADIAAVAPGIAEALTTTLAGLLVAIPALVMFSYLQVALASFETEVTELADQCVWIMRTMVARAEVKTPFVMSEKEAG